MLGMDGTLLSNGVKGVSIFGRLTTSVGGNKGPDGPVGWAGRGNGGVT